MIGRVFIGGRSGTDSVNCLDGAVTLLLPERWASDAWVNKSAINSTIPALMDILFIFVGFDKKKSRDAANNNVECKLSESKTVVIPGSSHAMMFDHAAELVREIKVFLNSSYKLT